MSVTTETPQASFRIDMLWTDSRYRSTFLQIIALIAVLMAGLYLVNNVAQNLAALGKEFGFGFMASPSSYDINQRLIEYTSRSSHSTAAVVGLLNTLLIAVMGCILATFLGVTAGVLRLSNNWIVSRLMTVYIEGVRNIPVLIQILLLAAILDETLPHPKQAEALLGGFVVPTNRGFYFPIPTFHDGSLVVVLAFIASVCGAIWFGRWATVTFFASAYMAEVIRGGLAALPTGQYEAADALGLNYWKATRLIIMPQALKISIPGIVNNFIGLFKDTTLVSVIGLLDPVGLLSPIRADSSWNGILWELYLFVALFFWAFCFSMSRYSMYLEKKLKTDR